MELTGWDIYWITRLDAMRGIFCGMTIIGALALTLGNLIFVMAKGEGLEAPWRKRYAVVPAVCLAFAAVGDALLPTTKEMCAIIAIPAIANSEEVQGMGKEVVDLAKDWLHELRPEPKPEALPKY